MLIVHPAEHRLHHPQRENYRGRMVDAFEIPARADYVLHAVQQAELAPIIAPDDFGLAPIAQVHSARYLDFLQRFWGQWSEQWRKNFPQRDAEPVDEAFPAVWPIRTLRDDVEPANLAAQLGLYSMDSGSPFTAGTWAASLSASQSALTAARHVLTHGGGAFSLSRPPGHHAGRDFFGGYCFLNHAAITAQWLRDQGLARVAVLDVDYHHGNGTQAIFYDRADVLTVSIHGDPRTEYPFYLGHADEQGQGAGLGYNLNLPLPVGTGFARWMQAVEQGMAQVRAFAPQALVVSLGLDTYGNDPIAGFTLQTADYPVLGAAIRALDLPTVMILEGGYAAAELGNNVVAVLRGFEQGRA